jgi:hypothetical protein
MQHQITLLPQNTPLSPLTAVRLVLPEKGARAAQKNDTTTAIFNACFERRKSLDPKKPR